MLPRRPIAHSAEISDFGLLKFVSLCTPHARYGRPVHRPSRSHRRFSLLRTQLLLLACPTPVLSLPCWRPSPLTSLLDRVQCLRSSTRHPLASHEYPTQHRRSSRQLGRLPLLYVDALAMREDVNLLADKAPPSPSTTACMYALVQLP